MARWERGRNPGTWYWKKKIFQFWRFDCWLIRYPPSVKLRNHCDTVPGKRHFRLNIVLKGKGEFIGERVLLKWRDRFTLFRSDATHSMKNGPTERLVLSIGAAI